MGAGTQNLRVSLRSAASVSVMLAALFQPGFVYADAAEAARERYRGIGGNAPLEIPYEGRYARASRSAAVVAPADMAELGDDEGYTVSGGPARRMGRHDSVYPERGAARRLPPVPNFDANGESVFGRQPMRVSRTLTPVSAIRDDKVDGSSLSEILDGAPALAPVKTQRIAVSGTSYEEYPDAPFARADSSAQDDTQTLRFPAPRAAGAKGNGDFSIEQEPNQAAAPVVPVEQYALQPNGYAPEYAQNISGSDNQPVRISFEAAANATPGGIAVSGVGATHSIRHEVIVQPGVVAEAVAQQAAMPISQQVVAVAAQMGSASFTPAEPLQAEPAAVAVHELAAPVAALPAIAMAEPAAPMAAVETPAAPEPAPAGDIDGLATVPVPTPSNPALPPMPTEQHVAVTRPFATVRRDDLNKTLPETEPSSAANDQEAPDADTPYSSVATPEAPLWEPVALIRAGRAERAALPEAAPESQVTAQEVSMLEAEPSPAAVAAAPLYNEIEQYVATEPTLIGKIDLTADVIRERPVGDYALVAGELPEEMHRQAAVPVAVAAPATIPAAVPMEVASLDMPEVPEIAEAAPSVPAMASPVASVVPQTYPAEEVVTINNAPVSGVLTLPADKAALASVQNVGQLSVAEAPVVARQPIMSSPQSAARVPLRQASMRQPMKVAASQEPKTSFFGGLLDAASVIMAPVMGKEKEVFIAAADSVPANTRSKKVAAQQVAAAAPQPEVIDTRSEQLDPNEQHMVWAPGMSDMQPQAQSEISLQNESPAIAGGPQTAHYIENSAQQYAELEPAAGGELMELPPEPLPSEPAPKPAVTVQPVIVAQAVEQPIPPLPVAEAPKPQNPVKAVSPERQLVKDNAQGKATIREEIVGEVRDLAKEMIPQLSVGMRDKAPEPLPSVKEMAAKKSAITATPLAAPKPPEQILKKEPSGLGEEPTKEPKSTLEIARSSTPSIEAEAEAKDDEGVGIKVQTKALKFNPDTYLEAAYEALLDGNTHIAADYYETILERFPNHIDAMFGLATTLHRVGETERAKRLYQRILDVNPDHLETLNNVLVLATQESPREALKELLVMEIKNPRYDPLPAQIAAAYAKIGEMDLAIAKIRRALELAPENMNYRYNLAVLLDHAGRNEDAIRAYQALKRSYDSGLKLPVSIASIQERLTFLLSNVSS